MLINNLKIAWRNLAKDKLYTAIKIGGFAIGIAVCMLIGLYIRDELNFDQNIPNKENIYRLVGQYDEYFMGEVLRGVHMPAPFAKALKEDFPEILKVGRYNAGELFGAGSKELRLADQNQNSFEEGFMWVDQSLLEIFAPKMIYGNVENALSQPNSIVLSKRKADKYFPNINPVGKLLVLDDDAENETFTIGGVMDNWAENSHLEVDFLMSLTDVEFWEGEQDNWNANNYPVYMVLHPEADIAALEKKLLDINTKYFLPAFQSVGMSDAEKRVDHLTYELQPIADIHLHSKSIMDGLQHGDIRFVWLFGTIAIFILLLACINFINLSTAKSANRGKEVGIRKTIGAFQGNLINQFLTESILFSAISFALGTILAYILIPYFNDIAGKLLFLPWGSLWFAPLLILSAIGIGILVGIYPAFFLSAFEPVKVLKGDLSRGTKNGRLRSVLVVFQFASSIILIIGTIIIYQQINYILNKEIGYDKDQVMVIQGTNTLGSKLPVLKEELQQMSEVKSVSISDYMPAKGSKQNGNMFWLAGREQEDQGVHGQFWLVDSDYVPTLGIQMKEGRNFSKDIASDSTDAVLINETLAAELNLENPVGTRISNGSPLTVIGVIEDFHFRSLKEKVGGLCMLMRESPSMMSIKLSGGNRRQTLQNITNIWNTFAPNQAIRYTFLDAEYAEMHDDIARMGHIFTSFTFFAILVACLGLFALSAFMIEQRKKEISIRLVLGASFQHIYYLIAANFMKLVFMAIIIAIPIAWYMMQRWLEGYAYRITIGWEVFALAGLLAFLIALITISYQAISAALANPSTNLRTE